MEDELRLLHAAIAHARHLLPEQAPIRIFVHHNTLHAFQHLPFDEAVLRGARVFGTEPYESESAFAAHLERGRITEADIVAVLADEALDDAPAISDGPSLRQLRALRLLHPLERVEGPALEWLLCEEGALSHFHPSVGATERQRLLASASEAASGPATEAGALSALWERLAPHAPVKQASTIGPRPRDRVLADHGVDVDEWIHPLLYRICAAYVDQGIAYWPMPARERGLLASFRELYRRAAGPPDPWLRGLAGRLAAESSAELDAAETAVAALRAMDVPSSQWDEVVEATLLALPGWAGMIAQLEERPDRAPVSAPPARLLDYVAVALLLESVAVDYVREERASEAAGAADDVRPPLYDRGAEEGAGADDVDMATVYEAFVLAQLAGIGPAQLDDERNAAALVREAHEFGSVQRRRLWHLAYEHHHRQEVLDAILAHEARGIAEHPAPAVQAFFCIDEREESLRRHLEELDPTMETVGYAGFYGVPMAYRGFTDVKPTPLCPVVIRPEHLVVEEAIEAREQRKGATRRQAIGKVRHASHVGSRTFVRGGALAATVGLAAVVPLVGRVLFPRFAERFSHAISDATLGGPKTRLRIERAEGDDTRNEDGLLPGFTVAEMVDIVAGVLGTTSIEGRLAPLIVIIGHGSSSLNNPHEAAHDCGATGGGRGGPNARAFAAMANHEGVRAALADRGTPIPQETYFIAGYHNTCDDGVAWYDLDLVPDAHRAELARVQSLFEVARRRDAHERCRRFESAPTSIGVDRALAHVEGRAVDLGEPRPEYGHATNAICIVGRREKTRGLFFDRRAFLVSYDPTRDPDGEVLGPLLASVGPVGAGINLEYYFSFVDPEGYGCGTKLPHNITGLIGVMNGHASDLRTGLPWQMVEIHEPVRLLTIVEAEPALLERILDEHPGVAEVVTNRWIQLVAQSPTTGELSFFSPRGFVPHVPRTREIPVVETSADHYRGHRGHLACARVESALRVETP